VNEGINAHAWRVRTPKNVQFSMRPRNYFELIHGWISQIAYNLQLVQHFGSSQLEVAIYERKRAHHGEIFTLNFEERCHEL
jgi:hypothetical protein